MSDIAQTLIATIATTFGVSIVGWVVTQMKNASRQLTENLTNESLARLADIVSVVVLDTTDVLGRSLVEHLRDGGLTGSELRDALDEAYEFLWSVLRNADKIRLAGDTDEGAKLAFKAAVLPRLEAEARRMAWLENVPYEEYTESEDDYGVI